MKYSYLIIDLGAILVPFIYSFHPKIKFYKSWKAFWLAAIITAIPFILWDMVYTKLGVWGFNPIHITGIHFFNLPIEELLFFICIPYACIFTWTWLQNLITKERVKGIEPFITILLVSFLLMGAVFFYPRLYTSLTFSALALAILFLKYILKVDWLSQFYFTYLILLIPFTIVNGLLTGTGFESPIVWYDNSQNMSIRLLTIPVEDIFYGMLLIMINVFLYEFFKRKFETKDY